MSVWWGWRLDAERGWEWYEIMKNRIMIVNDEIYRSFGAAKLGRSGSNLGSLLECVRNSSSNYFEIHLKSLWNEK